MFSLIEFFLGEEIVSKLRQRRPYGLKSVYKYFNVCKFKLAYDESKIILLVEKLRLKTH